jgi:hypothetical protein
LCTKQLLTSIAYKLPIRIILLMLNSSYICGMQDGGSNKRRNQMAAGQYPESTSAVKTAQINHPAASLHLHSLRQFKGYGSIHLICGVWHVYTSCFCQAHKSVFRRITFSAEPMNVANAAHETGTSLSWTENDLNAIPAVLRAVVSVEWLLRQANRRLQAEGR